MLRDVQARRHQEKLWAEYLFRDGSMIGLGHPEPVRRVHHQPAHDGRGLAPAFAQVKHNPIPWINTWLSSDTVQVAPQWN